MRKTLTTLLIIFGLIAIGSGIYLALQPETNMYTVDLYYYNQPADFDASGNIMCSPDAVLPVQRQISSEQVITDTINLLLEGSLTDAERESGFSTEFPHEGFYLMDASLSNGVLTLTFPDVPGFTIGGACRVGILYAQVSKTAAQFPGVESVRILPEEIFQP